jgi:hypothetical protein
MQRTLVIPAQAGIQRAKRKGKIWTPAFAGVTRKLFLTSILAALMAACLLALPATELRAGPPGDIGSALQHEPLFTPVLVWRDCQRIALCTGCRPVFKCRSCTYRRTCAGGICGWGDVCVWGPYVKVLPRGARIIR